MLRFAFIEIYEYKMQRQMLNIHSEIEMFQSYESIGPINKIVVLINVQPIASLTKLILLNLN